MVAGPPNWTPAKTPASLARAVMMTSEKQDPKGHREPCVQIKEELPCRTGVSVLCVATTGRFRTCGWKKLRGRQISPRDKEELSCHAWQPQLSLEGMICFGRKAAPLLCRSVWRLKKHLEGLLRRNSEPRRGCWARELLRLPRLQVSMSLKVSVQMCRELHPCWFSVLSRSSSTHQTHHFSEAHSNLVHPSYSLTMPLNFSFLLCHYLCLPSPSP